MNIREFLESKVSKNKERVYLSFEDQELTYRQFNDHVNRAANGFLELGVRRGDRVCLMMVNSPQFLFAWLGLSKVGAVLVPINTAFKVNEASYIVEHCGAVGMMTNPDLLGIALSVQKRAAGLKWVGVLGKESEGTAIPISPLWERSPVVLQKEIELHDEDLASIIYTSGTTGPPKGVMHSHRSYILCGEAMTLRAQLAPEDRLMIILPLFHANAQFYSTMGSLAAEATLLLTPRFSASQFWHQAKQLGATQFSFIGAIGRILLSRPMEEFVPDHAIRVANGGYIPADVYEGFTERFKIPHVIDGYGLTECPSVCQNPIDGIKKMGSMGLPSKHPDPSIRFTEMKIVNDQDRELPAGKVGELVLRSPALMKGYFRDPAQTAEAMRGGWFHTGDFCYRDEDGYYFFVDRKKDIIRRKGENISSVEVETVINGHPKVLESAVIPVPSLLGEEEVKAVVVLREGQDLSPEEFTGWCSERLADFKIPRFLEYREFLPKTPSQRTAKYLLKQESGREGTLDLNQIQRGMAKVKGPLYGGVTKPLEAGTGGTERSRRMNIMVIAPGSMSQEEINVRQQYAESLCSSGIKFVPVEGPASLTDDASLGLLIPGVIKRAEEAERQGYDAVVIHCFADIGIDGAKTVANIPVIGAAESVYRVASLLADRFGLITARDEFLPSFYRRARTLGVHDRIVSSRSINIPVLELRQRRQEVEARFVERVIEAKRDGAEIILVACLAILPTIGKDSASRLGQELGIQIIDGTATALRMAEMLVHLGLRQSPFAFPRAAETRRLQE